MEYQTIACNSCGHPMPIERLECGFKLCIKCQDEKPYVGFQVFPHKTAGSPIFIKPKNNEDLRQALRANRRAR